MEFDAIVAGAGIWGCTVARRLAEAGKRVLVLEKRKAVGGNCRCEIDPETGIEVHTYGSHIFHTSNEEVWAFVRRFTEFNDYRHCVLAKTRATGRGESKSKVEERTGLNSAVDEFVSNASDGIEHSSSDAIGTIASTVDRRRCAEKKVEEWLAGVDETTFEAALVKLVEEKTAAGEYRFKKSGERELALEGARKFYREFSRKIVPLSDGRYVYFAPDERAKIRNANNAISWAEYAFHAVSNGGAKVSGKNYNERWYNPYKQPAFAMIGGVLKREKCFIRLSSADARFHAIVFAGTEDASSRLQVVTRLDDVGNIDANLSEVTFTASHREKKSPRLVPLTEAVRTVVHYQTATGSYPPNESSIAFSETESKGGGEGKSNSRVEVEGRTGEQGVGDRCTVDGLRSSVDAASSPRQKENANVLVGRGEDAASTGGTNRALPRSNRHSSTSTSSFDSSLIHTPTLNSNSYHTYHLPVGKTLLEEFFGLPMKDRNLKEFLAENVDAASSPRQKENANVLVGRGEDAASTGASRTYGSAIFNAFIKGYTSKQWGVPPEKVDPSVIARLKVRDSYSTDYFDDPHQGIPVDGYNKIFERMLDHPNITIETEMTVKMVGTALRAVRNPDSTQSALEIDCGAAGVRALPIYYSGPIDALFNYKFGALPWRTLRFERETLPVADYQGNSVVNYPDLDVPFTRIHEFAHYHPESNGILTSAIPNSSFQVPTSRRTIISREYSATWQPGDEPYYPIATPESAALLARYQEEVLKFGGLEDWDGGSLENLNSESSSQPSNPPTFPPSNHPNIRLTVGGRLGQYKYYDMDKSIAAALDLQI